MESMTYTLNDTQVVALESEFDAMAVSELRPLFEKLSEYTGDVLADLRDVHFIDSSGIGALVFLHKRLVMNGHHLWSGATPRSAGHVAHQPGHSLS